ncbi:Cpe/LpqF family protein [Microbacterium sp. 2P01SA-2]|uniref:serine hydrolase n=1 Tax=unclassified Microbacterium TaxID=2609290 RepID=UPI0039A28427
MSSPIDTRNALSSPLSRRRGPAVAAIATAAVAALAACSAEPASEQVSASPSVPVEIPATPVGEQSRWVMDEINGDEQTDVAEIEAHFDAAALQQLTAADLQEVFGQMQAAAPWTAVAYEGAENQARVTIESAEVTYDMSISVTPDALIEMLFFGMPEPERTPAASWDELTQQIDDAAFTAGVQVREVDGEVLYEGGDPGAGPIGSIFKLWVLGAVVDAVAEERLSWDDELVVDATVRSLPSGELQDRPDGTTVTVREAADKMIAISDNTATDMLIRAVGRDAVEAAMLAMGHSDPDANTPLPTTRELFWLLFGDTELRELWSGASGDADARRSVLERLPAGVPDLAAASTAQPGWRDGIDWFATPDDLAAAHVALQERATTEAGAPVREILSVNPGLDFGDAWTYVGFKGGSSIGVLAGSWYLEREDGAPVVITVLARADDAATLANPAAALGWAQDAAALVAGP